MSTRRYLLVSVLCFGTFLNIFSQGLSGQTWYVGTKGNGIRFNLSTDSATALSGNVGLGTGGGAVATDPSTGNLLFYTDGNNIYDANHKFMPNGTGLTGNPGSNQPVVICHVPGVPGQYYVFTNSATSTSAGAISYTIVDMTQFGNAAFPVPATGDVISKNNSIDPLLNNVGQAMILIPNANNDGFWLITQVPGTDQYHVLQIDQNGMTMITTYSGVGLPIEAANFAYHPGTGRLAVSPEDPTNNVMILNFDDATGALSVFASVVNSGQDVTGNESVYDAEWSADGNFLYVSVHGETGVTADVLQYDVINPTTTLESVLPAPIYRSYGLQMGPDSLIYHLYQETSGGPILLGRIGITDSVASKTTYETDPFLVGDYNGKQFSTTLPAYDAGLTLSFTSTGTCANTPIQFLPEIEPGADSVRWDFGDGTSSSMLSPVHSYATGGAMDVSLMAWSGGIPDTLSQPVTITDFQLQINLVQDTVACKCELPVHSAEPECAGTTQFFTVTAEVQGGTPTSIRWSNGQTGTTLAPDSAGYYYVVVTDASGCSAYAGVNVREYDLIDMRANIWYFGDHAGIDFNTLPDPPVALDDSNMDAVEGSSAISDRNGQIIFYTDGNAVYDKNHNLIATAIGGDPTSAQSAVIVPFPGDETLYYIFTTQEVYGTGTFELKYSIFDLKQNNGDGAVVVQDVLLFAKSTERIAVVGNWLIAHEYGNSTFRAYPIAADGIGLPVKSEIGSVHSFNTAENGQGYMKVSSTGKLVVTLSDPGNYNVVEMFDFDAGTGELTNYEKIDLNEPNGQVYGVEFSPGGNKLFATITGSGQSYIVEYYLDSLGDPHFMQTITEVGELGAIQIAPDGQLYVAVNGSDILGGIIANEDTTQFSQYNPTAFVLAAGTSSSMGLPSFSQAIGTAPQTPGFLATGFCLGDSTLFTATGTDIIDEFAWFFGDGASGVGQTTAHIYNSPGDYVVALNITNRCGLDTTISQTITIYDVPANPITPNTAELCSGPVTLQAADPADPQFANYFFFWSTGETTNTITVDEQSAVSVTIYNGAGCSSFGQTLVIDNRPVVDLGVDQTVCEDQFVLDLDAGNTGATYEWRINGVVAGSTQTIPVNTSVPGVFNYEVTVTDPLTLCYIIEDKTYTVVEIPQFVINATNSPGCNNNAGEINVDIATVGSYTYYINGPDFRNGINQAGPTNAITETNLPIGTYFVIIEDEVSKCQVIQTVVIADEGSVMVVVPTSNPGCGSITVNVDIQDGTYVGTSGFNYTLTNIADGTLTSGNVLAEPFDTSPVPPGNYTLQLEDIASTCIQLTGPFAVTESPQATLSVTTDECAVPVTITASSNAANAQFTWTGPGGFSATGKTVNPSVTGDYIVTIDDLSGATCPNTLTENVVVNNFTPEIILTGDPCSGQLMLEASPATGNYSYLWSGPQTGGQLLLVTSATSGTYNLKVRDQNTGCVRDAAPVDAFTVDPVSVSLSSTLACDDGNPFTLTATAEPVGVDLKWYKDGGLVSDSTNTTFSSIPGGLFRVEASSQAGEVVCSDAAEMLITLAPYSKPDLPNRVAICDDPDNPDPATSEITFDPGSIFVDFLWKQDGLEVSTDQIYTASQAALYTVDLLNAYGCPAADTVEVVRECDPILNIPNAFSPNGNGQNEEFFIYTIFVADEFEVSVFNRWGELVFLSNDKDFRWNGGYNNDIGNPLPGGTYVYVMKYSSIYQLERGVQELRGGVVLLR